MPKNDVASWDVDADENTDVGGNNIAELCPPSTLNNAIRMVMAQVKAWYDNVPRLNADNIFSGRNRFPQILFSNTTISSLSNRGIRFYINDSVDPAEFGTEVGSIYYDGARTVMNSAGAGFYTQTNFTVDNSSVVFDRNGFVKGQLVAEDGGFLESYAGYDRIAVNGAEIARVVTGGLGVGKTTQAISADDLGPGIFLNSAGLLWVNREDGAAAIMKRSSSNGVVVQFVRNTTPVGSISVTTTATAYNTSSDERLKKDFKAIDTSMLDKIDVYDFAWKNGDGRAHGVKAQKLFPVMPEAVTKGDKPSDMWSVDYSKLVPLLLATVKDLRKRVSELEGK